MAFGAATSRGARVGSTEGRCLVGGVRRKGADVNQNEQSTNVITSPEICLVNAKGI